MITSTESPTRERIVTEAIRLFARDGFSGTTVGDVNRLVKQFSEMQKMMKKMGGMGMGKGKKGKKGRAMPNMAAMPGGFPKFN